MNQVHELNNEAWSEWHEYRTKEKRKKIGLMAQEKQQKFLRQFPPPVQQVIVDQSIMNSWQGLFAPKGGNNAVTTGHAGADRDTRRLSAGDRVRQRAEQRRADTAREINPYVGSSR